MNNFTFKVEPLLFYGKENALTWEQIGDAIGIHHRSAVSAIIKAERLNGALIISTRSNQKKGYYKPSSFEELMEYIMMEESSALTSSMIAKKARERLPEFLEEQTNLLDEV